jgi:hypothetical protein
MEGPLLASSTSPAFACEELPKLTPGRLTLGNAPGQRGRWTLHTASSHTLPGRLMVGRSALDAVAEVRPLLWQLGPIGFRRVGNDSETPAGGGLTPRALERAINCDHQRVRQGQGLPRRALRPARLLRPLFRVGHHAETCSDELTRTTKGRALVEAVVQAGRRSSCTASSDAGSIPAGSTRRASCKSRIERKVLTRSTRVYA